MNQENKPAVKPETGLEVANLFAQHSMAAKTIMDLALANTLPSDWWNMGGNAWLDAPGAERIGRALGLTIKDWTWEKMDFKDDDGVHYYIVSRGKVGHEPSNLWTDAIGVAWSRKPFWYKSGDYKKHVGEINMGNIIKDSYSDMERNGITRLLGLRGLPWSHLKDYGIDQKTAKQVEFEAGARGGRTTKKTSQNGAGVEAQESSINYLVKIALQKVIKAKDEDIRKTLPGKLATDKLNVLLKYVMEIENAVSLDEWKSKVKEVIGK